MRYIVFGIIALSIFGHSCKKDKADEPIPFDCSDTLISFSATIQPLVMGSCATTGCHNNSGAGGYVFGNHASIEVNKDIILRTIRHEVGVVPMPVGTKLTAEQIQYFTCWVEQGALDN